MEDFQFLCDLFCFVIFKDKRDDYFYKISFYYVFSLRQGWDNNEKRMRCKIWKIICNLNEFLEIVC